YNTAYAVKDGYVYVLTLDKDEIFVKVDGELLKFDVPPVLQNDRTLVPFRAIFEALGATVDWDESTQTATAVKGDITLKITVGDNKLYKNGEAIELDVPAQIINDSTLMPVRAVSEAFGCEVNWLDQTQTVVIFSE
ncbi:MAG: copper amine oxidase N-terminal domain-containing protein, partial [Clostridia bacterium]|nr:copper amine oxidase N-terminal domain-containing protein [Clostridia bacterium]